MWPCQKKAFVNKVNSKIIKKKKMCGTQSLSKAAYLFPF